ncbi:L-threonylcarbamoyladenylate synthase [Oleidesulfovibrio alaskensis]|jgi:L-threonylcarbamoyladenylate synthase|uniref:L-threonylcarbamoyladenylate synthase n=1 Tax=Oleidesulfovibrio alaskensis TaxID=58180 RepID=UPI001A4F9DF9|nr:L-threonylcarbamoyladenylate synthase [Oleidesulfovibrio alaskensis]MBL3583428.1 threonylcarbamoyl-AMP synthase [Oleidesulfovibrio alaskensis]
MMTQQTIPVTDVNEAAVLLQEGKVVVYPTETFFAVGCLATDVRAVDAVYRIKRRPSGMPLPVIIGSAGQLGLVTAVSSPLVTRLAELFWPGPLSVLVTASDRIPAILTGETGRVAVRVTPHPAAAALCTACGGALVSTSANISGRQAVTAASGLDPELVGQVAAVVDMPPAPAGGKPSTLVEVAGPAHVRIVRPGVVTEDALQTAGISVVV